LGQRKLSFSEILEEKYIAELANDNESLKERIETITKRGQIFDQSKEYLFYLLNTEQGN